MTRLQLAVPLLSNGNDVIKNSWIYMTSPNMISELGSPNYIYTEIRDIDCLSVLGDFLRWIPLYAINIHNIRCLIPFLPLSILKFWGPLAETLSYDCRKEEFSIENVFVDGDYTNYTNHERNVHVLMFTDNILGVTCMLEKVVF